MTINFLKSLYPKILILALSIFLCLSIGCSYAETKNQEITQKKITEIATCREQADEKSIKVVLKYVKDKNELVREQAAFAAGATSVCFCTNHADTTSIGKLQDTRMLEALIKLLKDQSPRVRFATVYSLLVYKSPIMVEPLIEILNDTSSPFNPDYPIGMYAAYILGELKDEKAIDPLVAAFRRDNTIIRSQAGNALRKMRKNDLVNEEIKKLTPLILTELQNNSQDSILRGIETSGDFRINEALPYVNSHLKHQAPKIRAAAAKALVYIGNETSVPGLSEAVKDPVKEVRDNATWALGVLNQKLSKP